MPCQSDHDDDDGLGCCCYFRRRQKQKGFEYPVSIKKEGFFLGKMFFGEIYMCLGGPKWGKKETRFVV